MIKSGKVTHCFPLCNYLAAPSKGKIWLLKMAPEKKSNSFWKLQKKKKIFGGKTVYKKEKTLLEFGMIAGSLVYLPNMIQQHTVYRVGSFPKKMSSCRKVYSKKWKTNIFLIWRKMPMITTTKKLSNAKHFEKFKKIIGCAALKKLDF